MSAGHNSFSEISSDDDSSNDERPVVAIAPSVSSEIEFAEVTASPAFQCLEELFEAGKISGSRMVELKSSYKKHHDFLAKIRESESTNMERAKKYSMVLEKQKDELAEADSSGINHDTEIGRMRQDYLVKMNDLGQIEDREQNQKFQIDNLQEELRILKLEYSRIPKPEFIEETKRKSAEEIDQLKKQIGKLHNEITNLKEEVEAKSQLKVTQAEALKRKKETGSDRKTELVVISSVPNQLSKETDKLLRQMKQVDEDLKQQRAHMKSIADELRQVSGRQRKVKTEREQVGADVEQLLAQHKGKEYEYHSLQREYDFEKERETVMLSDRATIDLQLRGALMTKKSVHDTMSKQLRDNEKDLKQLKRVLAQESVAEESLALVQSIYSKIQAKRSEYPDVSPLQTKRESLQEEVEEAKRKHAAQTALTSVEQVKLEDLMLVQVRLNKQLQELRTTVVDFHRLSQIKADEREQKSRDFVRSEFRFQKSSEELKAKQHSLTDHNKRHVEVKVQLQQFAKLYNTIKNERNKIVTQIQSCTQKSVEMREKMRILSNEIDILRNSVIGKDKELQRARLQMMNEMVARDALRNEQSKAGAHERGLRDEREQIKLEMGRLTLANNHAEEHMVQLRKKYEDAVQHRNDRGVQLVEREEEVCIFYEKINVQETMIKNGDLKLNEVEDSIKFMKLQKAEDLRLLELARKNVPKLRNLNDELVTLQIQVSQCNDRRRSLEKRAGNSDNPERIRMLGGTDPSPAEMQDMLENLEMQVAEKEEKLMEMELIFEQSSKLTERIELKVNSGKDDSLTLAKKVNNYQDRIKSTTRKMMSVVSELSMKQAHVMQLQQECKARQNHLDQCHLRLDMGDAPDADIEAEWVKMEIKEMQAQQDRMEKAFMEEEERNYQLTDGSMTTAEPRPNAYIPDDSSGLPLSKPYGKHAPFKPTETGSNMRHIRKPVLKPIEI